MLKSTHNHPPMPVMLPKTDPNPLYRARRCQEFARCIEARGPPRTGPLVPASYNLVGIHRSGVRRLPRRPPVILDLLVRLVLCYSLLLRRYRGSLVDGNSRGRDDVLDDVPLLARGPPAGRDGDYIAEPEGRVRVVDQILSGIQEPLRGETVISSTARRGTLPGCTGPYLLHLRVPLPSADPDLDRLLHEPGGHHDTVKFPRYPLRGAGKRAEQRRHRPNRVLVRWVEIWLASYYRSLDVGFEHDG